MQKIVGRQSGGGLVLAGAAQRRLVLIASIQASQTTNGRYGLIRA